MSFVRVLYKPTASKGDDEVGTFTPLFTPVRTLVNYLQSLYFFCSFSLYLPPERGSNILQGGGHNRRYSCPHLSFHILKAYDEVNYW